VDIDDELLAQLKEWRLKISKELSVPAYVVFTDNTLIAIAESLPGDDAALVAIPGIGARKLEQFGADVLALVRAEAEDLIGAPIAGATLHRWKFSHARTTDAEPFIWWSQEQLGFAGDAFGGPRVEGAAVSGLALAECVKAELARGLV
jgi:predicted NAD/FAD-dependent oxidoreductase